MTKCKQCKKEIKQTGNRKKEFCSDKCRMAFKRSNPNIQSEQIQSEQSNPNKYELLEGKVYGRQAVSYGKESNEMISWDTRPMPENPDDVPDPKNRCIFRRKDGSKYIIDSVGNILGFNE